MKTGVQINTCMQIFIAAIFTIVQNWKQPIFICGWKDKQNMVYPHNEILFSHKKGMEHWYTLQGWTSKHETKQKKPDTKYLTLYDSIYMKYIELVNPQRQKADRSKSKVLALAGQGWKIQQPSFSLNSLAKCF